MGKSRCHSEDDVRLSQGQARVFPPRTVVQGRVQPHDLHHDRRHEEKRTSHFLRQPGPRALDRDRIEYSVDLEQQSTMEWRNRGRSLAERFERL